MAKKAENEKVRPLILRDSEEGTEYTLEFNRESVKFAENRRFDISEVSKYPLSKIPELFYYAFRMHHKNISREKTDRILFEDLGGMPDGMLERLVMLYSAPFEALTSGAGDGEPKKSKMTVEF